MNKMPDGSFAVDSEQFEIVRDTKAPYIPTLKVVGGGGSSELPSEVENAIETGGMGWTDEDETIHKIDEKYIPSSGGGAVVVTFTVGESGMTPSHTPSEVREAMLTNVVIGVLASFEGIQAPFGPAYCNTVGEVDTIYFFTAGETSEYATLRGVIKGDIDTGVWTTIV